MEHQLMLVLNLGGPYSQLIARRVRNMGVYCEVIPHTLTAREIAAKQPIGILLTGGDRAVCAPDSPQVDQGIYQLGIPILGIGYGAGLMAHQLGGSAAPPPRREGEITTAALESSGALFQGLDSEQSVRMSGADGVDKLPPGFAGMAQTSHARYAAIEDASRSFYGLAFHPELEQTQNGLEMMRRFLFDRCGAQGDWTMETYSRALIAQVQEQVRTGRVLLALSGGVDSSVVAALLSQAIGNQLTCIFVDHGLMRKDEGDEVEAAFSGRELGFVRVNAKERFLSRLQGVTDPEHKRKIIGEEFIRVFEEEAKKIGNVDFLAQGTIYPDIIESGAGDSAVIKSHHNVGGLPDHVDFKEIVEPLRLLFKDEVRALGSTLGLPDYLVWRQPFPGPGLAIRCLGEVTEEKLDILRAADFIYREEIARAGLDRSIHQYFAVLTNMRSVGVKDHRRTYDYTLALRGVTTGDFMTADWAKIPYEVLEKSAARIAREVRGINRIVYDITSKPPGTIEWE